MQLVQYIMTDHVKHNITKLYEPKKTTGEKGVFIQVISTLQRGRVNVCPLFLRKNSWDLLLLGRIGWRWIYPGQGIQNLEPEQHTHTCFIAPITSIYEPGLDILETDLHTIWTFYFFRSRLSKVKSITHRHTDIYVTENITTPHSWAVKIITLATNIPDFYYRAGCSNTHQYWLILMLDFTYLGTETV